MFALVGPLVGKSPSDGSVVRRPHFRPFCGQNPSFEGRTVQTLYTSISVGRQHISHEPKALPLATLRVDGQMHFADTSVFFAEGLNFFFTSAVRDVRQEDARVAVVVAVRLLRYCFVVVGLCGETVSDSRSSGRSSTLSRP